MSSIKVSHLMSSWAGEIAHAAEVIKDATIHPEMSYDAYMIVRSMLIDVISKGGSLQKQFDEAEKE